MRKVQLHVDWTRAIHFGVWRSTFLRALFVAILLCQSVSPIAAHANPTGFRASDNVRTVLFHRIRMDWNQLGHWNTSVSALSAGSVALYREPMLQEQDRKYFIPAIVLIAALLLVVAWLVWERERKRKAEAALQESEQRFQTMADNTPSMIWMCDRQGRISYVNNGIQEFYGPDSDVYGDSWIDHVHPDDVNRVLDVSTQALEAQKPFSKQYRIRRWDGVYRWIVDVATPRLNGDGSFAGYIGSAMDITDQKQAQEALEKIGGKLIEAQEEERRRIARELHDDICQRLAIVSIELEQANRNGSSPATRERLEEIRLHCAGIANDIQSLSRQLHSSRLDYLGIAAAIGGFCREFAKQYKLDIHFIDENLPPQLAKSTSLCLFRVTQEALHNAVKYSGVNRFTVELRGVAEEVYLVVSDAGSGFDLEKAQAQEGIGLMSMQERVRLVQGRFHVESRPGHGTRITAVVPAPAASI
jgi:PAS domain S-box-containing protein